MKDKLIFKTYYKQRLICKELLEIYKYQKSKVYEYTIKESDTQIVLKHINAIQLNSQEEKRQINITLRCCFLCINLGKMKCSRMDLIAKVW